MITLAECGQLEEDDLGEGEWQVWSADHGRIGTIVSNTSASSYSLEDVASAAGWMRFYSAITCSSQGPLIRRDKTRRYLKTTEVHDDELCVPRSQYKPLVIRSRDLTYRDALDYCTAFGGRLPSISDPDDLTTLVRELASSSVPLLSAWCASESDKCTVLMAWQNKGVEWFSVPCQETTVFLACQVPKHLSFELRVDDYSAMNMKLYLVPEDLIPRFVSLSRKQVIVNEGPLSLVDVENRTIATSFYTGIQPVGREEWEFPSGFRKNMTITACSKVR
ncbi:uncharacterized protein LOC119572468 [Penaeus monodon]|uniref:uncharacterized protein LOC119572468 n=1 Tax=Penaeus monodon TaxID=6687 RepID=UPI0018A6EF78|nr:uncharacterized protein LOC119572468 [Penaeus monodon]